MLRKTIAMIMAIAIVGGTMCTTATVNDKDRLTAVAAEADEIIEPDEDGIVTKDGVKYEIYNGDTWVVGYTKDLKGDLVIPEKINGVPVTIIDDEVFANCAEITSVTIPASILSIGKYAFKNCEKLKSADIKSPDIFNASISVSDWSGLFAFCPNLEKVTYAADGNSNFKATLFYTGKLRAGDYDADKYTYESSYGMLIPKSLKAIEITEGTTINEEEFKDIASLETIHLPKNLETIGEEAFSGCENIKALVPPDSLKTIEDFAFYGLTNIKSVTLPAAV